MTTVIGTFPFGTECFGATVVRAPIAVVVTAPLGTVTEAHPTVTWDYTSPSGRVQHHATVRVFDQSGYQLASERVNGATTSRTLNYALSPNTSYRIRVTVHQFAAASAADDGFDDTQIQVADFGVEGIAVVAVGSVYEIAINGVGLMLADTDDRRVERQTVQLEAPRLATGDTPFSEAIERYSFIGFTDWTGGEGQRYRDLEGSNPSRYHHSRNVHPFEPGEVSLVYDVDLHVASGYDDQLAVVARFDASNPNCVYFLTAANTLTALPSPGVSETTFSPLASGTVVSLASDGRYWYATDGTVIRRNNTDAGPGVDWSTVAVTEIVWCSDRLAGLDTAASPPNFTTFASDGTEEVGGGRFGFAGATLAGLCGGDGYMWWGVNRGIGGEVRAWQVDATPSVSFTALTLPTDEVVDNLYFYLGNVMLSARNAGSNKMKLYRCAPSEGRLTPSLVVELPDADERGRMRFAGMDRFVAFSWERMLGAGELDPQQSAIGVLDLQSGGYCRYLALGTEDTTPSFGGIVAWFGQFSATLDEQGFHGTPEEPRYVATGWLNTSISDLGSSLPKHLDQVRVNHLPLAGSITVYHSTDSNFTFTTDGTTNAPGSTGATFAANVTSTSFGFRVELTATEELDRTPVLTMLQAKIHPTAPSDQIVSFPVNCADVIAGLNGVTIEPDSGPGRGMARARWLESLVGLDVVVQDIDWPVTKTPLSYQVIGAELQTLGVFARHVNRRADPPVVTVTLRRAMN